MKKRWLASQRLVAQDDIVEGWPKPLGKLRRPTLFNSSWDALAVFRDDLQFKKGREDERLSEIPWEMGRKREKRQISEFPNTNCGAVCFDWELSLRVDMACDRVWARL